MIQDQTIELGSGMNDSLHEAQLSEGECALLRNWLPKGGEWQSREGAIYVHSTVADQRLLTPFAFRTNVATDYLLCAGSKDQVKKQSGGGFVNIPQQGVVLSSPTSSEDKWNWFFITRGLITYACRRGMKDTVSGNGQVYHITKDRVTRAGHLPPSTAPNCSAAAGGGATEAGDYVCAYTFVMDMGSANETESDLSPTDTVTGLTVGQQIVFAGLEVSNHPRCNGRRLYLSVPGGATLFRVLEIGNIPGTFIANIDIAVDDFGDEAITGMTKPPNNCECLVVWDGKMWTHDGTALWQSEPLKYETFDPLKSFTISRPPNTPSRFRGLLPWDGSRLAVGMDYSFHYLVRDPSALIGYKIEDVTTNIGLASTWGMCVAEGTLFWYSGNQIWATTGGNPVCVSDKKMERTLSQIPLAMREFVVMTYDERDGRVLISFASKSTSTENDLMMAFSLRESKWSLVSYFDSSDGLTRYAPHWMGYVPAPAPYNLKYLGATFSNMNRILSLESTSYVDQGAEGFQNVRLEFISEALQATGLAVCIRRIRLAVSERDQTHDAGVRPGGLGATNIQATVSLRLDGVRETSSVVVSLSDEWNTIGIDNLDDPANTVSVHVIIDSAVSLAAYGLVAEVAILKRRVGRVA